MKIQSRGIALAISALLTFSTAPYLQAETQTAPQTKIDDSSRLLALEGGSNFRDLGGYTTADNKTVRSGVLFRSGTMSSLTSADEKTLNKRHFKTVVDLRSQEELALYPNRWVSHNPSISYINHPYSVAEMKLNAPEGKNKPIGIEGFYGNISELYQPQMKMYFQELLNNNTPLVVNCSAGQDRTGFASALLLSALGVPRETIAQDYLLSTQYRRPAVERGDVDLEAAAKTNAFAKMMLHYNKKESKGPMPLITADGTPFINIAFAHIEQKYGSVENYLDQALAVDATEINKLKALYLQ
ncbi:MAG: tyrosine-protein phosphatase [Zhongshania sp.]|uniref:tyrosine-protein phosphatase n=1 Tax=Zhongshania sp. TaxID=1971902 RepID=UPI002606EC3B|nr:tyrosine-protein phosphatase [Zhongshania sp.]MDF1692289.1 tyrosine-protein phosphatase [Zhongshania sp.]